MSTNSKSIRNKNLAACHILLLVACHGSGGHKTEIDQIQTRLLHYNVRIIVSKTGTVSLQDINKQIYSIKQMQYVCTCGYDFITRN